MNDAETETTYKFAELSDKAKDKARQDFTGEGYLSYDWWDSTYEDAVRVAEILGITIGTRNTKTVGGKTRGTPDIWFSGFCSQGQGASFSGQYRYNPKAVAQIHDSCNDECLIELANELTLMQVTHRLQGLCYFTGSISHPGRGHYILAEIAEDDTAGEDTVSDIEDEFQQLMQNFADWICRQLEAEYDWLMSDECVDECLEDGMEFEEDGTAV